MINNDKDFQRQVVKQLTRIADSLNDISKMSSDNRETLNYISKTLDEKDDDSYNKSKACCYDCSKRYVCTHDDKIYCTSNSYCYFEKDF